MATLTNTKIKDTYVGLLKTTDNQAIDASGVTLVEDGAGNASALSVGRSGNGVTITGTTTSTAFAGNLTGNVTGNLTGTVLTAAQTNITSVGTLSSLDVSGNLSVDTDTLYVAAAANRVGIGTSNPQRVFSVNSEGTQIGSVFESTSTISSQINIINANSTNGGFIKTTGDNIILTANNTGAEHLVVADGGNVGIGTSSPTGFESGTTALEVSGTGSELILRNNTQMLTNEFIGGIGFANNDTGEGGNQAVGIKAYAADAQGNAYLTFHTGTGYSGGSESMRIDSSGNVGIGTSSPTQALDVAGNINVSTGSSLYFGSTSVGILGNASGADYIAFSTNSGERMRIDSNGSVGIGTSSPAAFYKLDVAGPARAALFALRSNETAPAESAFIYRPATGVIGFGTANTERMRIDSSGNVGINESDPSGYWSQAHNLVLSDSNTGITIKSATNGNGRLIFTDTKSATAGLSDGGMIHYDHNTDSMQLHANGSERMRITSAGAVFMYDIIGFSGTNSDVRYDTASGQIYYLTSSERYKSEITSLEDSLGKVNALRPVRFKDNYSEQYTTGLIAEEVVDVIPEVVFKKEIEGYDEPQPEGVNYSDLTPFLIKAIKELSAKVAALESQLNA